MLKRKTFVMDQSDFAFCRFRSFSKKKDPAFLLPLRTRGRNRGLSGIRPWVPRVRLSLVDRNLGPRPNLRT